MMKNILIGLACVFVFIGCSQKDTVQTPCGVAQMSDSSEFAPQRLKIRPIIGSRASDSKMSRDFGYIQKVWVAQYVNDSDNLIASHDVYVVVKEPHWVVGEKLPIAKKRGLTALKAPTFQSAISPSEIEGEEVNDKTVKEFINNLGKLDKNPQEIVDKADSSAYDDEIKKYLEKKRNSK